MMAFFSQELRKLVRKVHAVFEGKADTEENEQGVEAAKKSLTCFLRALAKQMPSEPNLTDL